MDLEAELVRWMDEHEAEMLDLLREEEGRFLALHPGVDPVESRVHIAAMANRRFIARALGAVLPRYLQAVHQ
ncbi:MAG TPA: hypothetical protein VKZ60_11030 [Chloroflexota bacterium]|jgi:hypothetical protein|nr:hypothetical protein [Chloroflexota bacterium]